MGFRSADEMVAAFSIKLWWKFRTVDSLWSRFLKSKYCRKAHCTVVEPRPADSAIWRRLCQARMLAESHIMWAVGDGSLSFWYDRWLGGRCLRQLHSSSPAVDLQVADFISRGDWDRDRLASLVPAHLVEAIAVVEIGMADTAYWCGLQSSNFTTKDAWLISRTAHPICADLEFLWHRSIPLKIYVLNWRLALNLLPVDIKMRDLGFIGPSKCHCCRNEETISHVFLSSEFAKEIWAYFNRIFGMQNVGNQNVYAVWKEWRSYHAWSAKAHIRCIVPLIICWAIWEARNEAKHSNTKMDHKRTIVRIEIKLKMLIKANLITKKICKGDENLCQALGIQMYPKECSTPFIVKWTKPERECIKLNVDGCSKGNPGPAAAGGILRDHMGKVILSFSKGLGIQNSYKAELLALLEGVDIAYKIGCSKIWIEMDSKILVKQVVNGYLGDWTSFSLFSKLYKILNQMNWKCTHIWREANSAADYMANIGIHSSPIRVDHVVHLSGPLKGITTLDRLGIPYIRGLKDA